MPRRRVTSWFPLRAAKLTEMKRTSSTPATAASRVTDAPGSRRLRRDRHLQHPARERRAAGAIELDPAVRPDPVRLALERDDLVAARAAHHLPAVPCDPLDEHLVDPADLGLVDLELDLARDLDQLLEPGLRDVVRQE